MDEPRDEGVYCTFHDTVHAQPCEEMIKSQGRNIPAVEVLDGSDTDPAADVDDSAAEESELEH